MITAYLGLDLHASSSTLGVMSGDGTYEGHQHPESFREAESELVPRVSSIDASEKVLAVEANTLSRWAARTLAPYVDRVLVCDPRENFLISRDARKSDVSDAYSLCRLLRLGELEEVYHAEEDHRAAFKATAQHYLDCRGQQVALKQKIKATYRRWGVFDLKGQRVYSKAGRSDYLGRISDSEVISQLQRLYQLLDQAVQAWTEAKTQLLRLGKKYPEIQRFQEVPGVGAICSHLFDAFVQTPARFSTRQKLWSYSQLSIRSQTSDGKPLGHEELDPNGRSELKSVSYRAFLSARRQADNAVNTFYEQSLERTGDPSHARLNTQRKILATLRALWINDTQYSPQKFLGSA